MEKKVHLIFSIVMSLFMISIMSFVVTYLNIGWTDQTIEKWLSSFVDCLDCRLSTTVYLWPNF